jgi:hypothetical protein
MKLSNLPAFERWFGGSTVLDDRGAPRQVYHGSRVGWIDRFDMQREGTGVVNTQRTRYGAIWFTSCPDNAAYYVGADAELSHLRGICRLPIEPAALPLQAHRF